jgi:hypothetical protein
VAPGAAKAQFALLVFLLSASCADGDDVHHVTQKAQLLEPAGCHESALQSRWVSSCVSYTATAYYGKLNPQWLGIDVPGIGFARELEQLFVYDAQNHRVLTLSDDLRFVNSFGRGGQGPGELVWQHLWQSTRLLVTDTAVYVYDVRAFHHFLPGGEFVGYVPGSHAGVIGHIRFIKSSGLLNGDVVVVADQSDTFNGTRALRVWKPSRSKPELIYELLAPNLPMIDGSYHSGEILNQAEPIAAVHGSCVYASDGHAHWLTRYSTATQSVDTISLPLQDIPSESKEDYEHRRAISLAMISWRHQVLRRHSFRLRSSFSSRFSIA